MDHFLGGAGTPLWQAQQYSVLASPMVRGRHQLNSFAVGVVT